MATDQVGGQRGQAIDLTLRPVVFDRDILAVDVTALRQSLAEWRYLVGKRTGGAKVEPADYWHRFLLCLVGKRGRDDAADAEKQVAPSIQ